MKFQPSLVLLFALSAAANGGDLVKRELPVLTIDLPSGEVVKQSTNPQTGALVMKLNNAESAKQLLENGDESKLLPIPARQIQVQWDPYPNSTEEDLKVLVGTVVGALPIPNARVLREIKLGDDRRVYLLGNDQLPISLALVNCGPSLGVNITMAFTVDLETLAAASERIAKSVTCKASTGAPQRPEMAVRLPKNFGRKYSEGVEMYMSTEGEMLVAGFAPQDMLRHKDLFLQVMSSMLSNVLGIASENMKLEVIPAGGAANGGQRSQLAVVRTKGEFDGAYVHVRYCAEQDLSLFTLWYAEESELKRAQERFGQLGCPGEPTEPVRDMAQVFEESCKAGNDYSCEMARQVDNL